MVDLKETINSISDKDTIPLLKTFYTLNEYFILQREFVIMLVMMFFMYIIFTHIATLKLCAFHTNLLRIFEPVVDRYLTELDVSITNDMKAFFDSETWMPVS